jgi:uncharacterized phage protein gp47/JayE
VAITRLDLFSIGRASILASNPKISSDQVNTDGSDVNLIVGGQSVMCGYLALQHEARFASQYLDSCEGDDLDRFGQDRYQQPRLGASPSVATVRFYRAGSGAGAGTVNPGTLLSSRNGIQFITTSPANFSSTALNATATCQAVQSGSQTKTGINGIITISTALFDSTLQVTNDVASAGGEDREDDDTYRERLRAFWLDARRGTLGAIEEGAKGVSGVVSAQAIETLNYLGLPGRAVLLYIADSAGIANQALATTVLQAEDDWRAAGIPVVVQIGSPQLVSLVLKLTFQATSNTITLTTSIINALVGFINTLGVNQTLTVGMLQSVLLRFQGDGLIVTQGTIVSPTGDLVPSLGQVIRTTTNLVTLQ